MNGFHVDIILNDIKVNEKSIQKLNIVCLISVLIILRCVFEIMMYPVIELSIQKGKKGIAKERQQNL